MKNFVSDILLLLTLAIGIVLYIPLIIIAVAFAVPLMFLFGIALLLNPKQREKINIHLKLKEGQQWFIYVYYLGFICLYLHYVKHQKEKMKELKKWIKIAPKNKLLRRFVWENLKELKVV